ncbi:basic amino acid ABC transporter substrate-binding protein [Bacillus rubiinfantis]|uniref:basic amino acid ABC transporter substrate-binding protein n=1 Tax=Bacillus rubiinfantis TaxID=1499680 RepID=UPI0005A822EE|nr:basic amino acid ABC transporter substrate-binding protein [Bacillus rubiinfantis]
MKKSKQIVSLLLAAFVLLLAACGSTETSKQSGGDGEKKKTLRVVTDAAYAPFEYQDKGEIVGFDIDFVKAVAKEAGYDVKIEHVGWDPIFVEIKGKTADFAVSSITINDERKQTYDFTVPYFLSKNEILVPKGSSIKGAQDLKGKVVAVQNGTTGQEVTEKILGENSKDLKKFENNNLAILEMKNGGADAVVADNGVVDTYVKNNPNDNFAVIEDDGAFEKEFYGLLLPKGSELKAELDKAINKIFENGTYAEIYKKWFNKEPDMQTLKAQQ